MPYSITTRDGITIDNIPDEVPHDAPELKQRVAQMRSQQPAAAAGAPASEITAPHSGIAMGLRDAVDAGAQMLRRAVPASVGNAVDNFGNYLASKGLPVAPSSGVEGVDKIVHDVNQQYNANRKVKAGGEDPGFDGQRLVGNMIQPANYLGAGGAAAASTVGRLALAGAKAGAVSGALQPVVGDTQDFWSTKAGQAAAGAATGAVVNPALVKGAGALTRGAQAVTAAARPAASPDVIRVQVTNILRNEGMDPASAPREILDSVQQQVQQAMQSGARLDPAAIVRRAQFEAVGLTGDAAPTLGQATRDPMQFANEKNLSGVRIKTPQGEGNPLADRFQVQNNRLGEVFDVAGAKDATDRVTAGQTIMDALRKADQPTKAGVDDAYAAARAMAGGRAAELDRTHFSQAANKALDEGMWGRFVPDNIRGMLNDVTSGKTPFTVDSAEQIDGILSAAQRRAGQGSPESSAIGVIRKSLHDTPFTAPAAPAADPAATAAANAARTMNDPGAPIVDVPFREPNAPRALPAPNGGNGSFQIPQPQPSAAVDEGAAAREAFAQARAAARQRFATIDGAPALKAALEGEAPDRFVQNYVLNANVQDLQAMKKVMEGSPEALAQARAQIAAHLKSAAFGANVSGDKAFTADRYMQTLRAIGPEKLKVFFSPAEMVRLNLAGKVASDINSRPAGAQYAVNGSGTGAALMNLLSKVSESPLLRQLPGGRALANQVGEIKTEREITRALSGQAPQAARELPPETVRALQLLFSPAGVAGGVLGGASVNP